MGILLIVCILIILLPGGGMQDSFQRRKWYIIAVCTIFTLLTGLRSLDIGADTLNYKASYEGVAQSSWNDLFLVMKSYFHSAGGMLANNTMRDPGYNIFVKFTQLFSTNYRIYLFILGLLVNIPLGILIFRNSTNPRLSLLIYFVLSFSFYGTTGYRQTIAFVLANLIGFKFIKERRLVPYIITIALGFFIHKSILINAAFYIIGSKKITKKYIFLLITAIGLSFVLRDSFSVIIKSISGYGEMYTGKYEGAGTWTFTIMLFAVWVCAFFFQDKLVEYDELSTFYLNAVSLALIFDPLTFINPSAMRIVEYFSFYLMLLIPNFLTIVNDRSKQLANAGIICLLLLLFVKSGQTYSFMW